MSDWTPIDALTEPAPGSTKVLARCPLCGDVELKPRDLTARVCTDTYEATVCFRCPDCDLPLTKSVPGPYVDRLVAAGVPLDLWRLPAELREHPEGDPIDEDDVARFHEFLERDDWFDRLVDLVDKR